METKIQKRKKCRKCKELLSIKKFHKDKSRKDGFNNYCVHCKQTYTLKYRRTTKGYLRRCWNHLNNKDRKDRNISFEELINIWNVFCNKNVLEGRHPHSCAYTFKKMTFIQGKGHIQTNLSIDRIDNNKSYIKNNITFCTRNFNIKKGQLTLDIMQKVLKFYKKEGIQYEME